MFPLLGPGGVPMTRSYPMAEVAGETRDHPHRRSLWFAHGDVGGFDFWQGDAHRERMVLAGPPAVGLTAAGADEIATTLSQATDQIERLTATASFVQQNGNRSALPSTPLLKSS